MASSKTQEQCFKCSGTGLYRSFGICFQCKGKGKIASGRGFILDNAPTVKSEPATCEVWGKAHSFVSNGETIRCACGEAK